MFKKVNMNDGVQKSKDNSRELLHNNIKKMQETVSVIESALSSLYSDASYEEIQVSIHELQRNTANLRRTIAESSSLLNIRNELFSYHAEPSVEITHQKTFWHFYIKEGLPHRIKEKDGVYKYYYDRNLVYSGYQSSVEKLLAEYPGIQKYQDKAWLYIVSHYPDKQGMIDHDNLDAKIFIDTCVKIPFLRDDSPDCLSIIWDSDISDVPGADVYLGSFENMLEIMKEIKTAR